MRVSFDPTVDAAYITIVDRIEDGEAVRQVIARSDDPNPSEFILDLDREGRLLGVEVLAASHQLRPETLALAGSE